MTTKLVNGKKIEMTEEEVKAFEESRKPNLEKEKQRKKKLNKRLCEDSILKMYPKYKQINLAIYGCSEEKEEFKNFKNFKTDKYHAWNRKIEACKNLEKLKDININYEEN